MLLKQSLSELSEELIVLLRNAAEPSLAAQVDSLEVVGRCSCREDFCASFYTAPKPAGAYGRGHRNLELEPDKGMIILDVVNEQIVKVEVLYRDDVRSQLASIFP